MDVVTSRGEVKSSPRWDEQDLLSHIRESVEIGEHKMDRYEVAAIAAINGLDDGEYHKVSAAQQREMFGFAVFGRKSIQFDSSNQGTVRVGRSACFGTDWTTVTLSYEQFAEHCNNQEAIEV